MCIRTGPIPPFLVRQVGPIFHLVVMNLRLPGSPDHRHRQLPVDEVRRQVRKETRSKGLTGTGNATSLSMVQGVVECFHLLVPAVLHPVARFLARLLAGVNHLDTGDMHHRLHLLNSVVRQALDREGLVDL